MTPILTGCWALAPVTSPSTARAAPAAIARRVVLFMPKPLLTCSPVPKEWPGPPPSANAMPFHGVAIEFDAEPRSFRQQDVPGVEHERRLQQLRPQGIVAHVVFEHQRMRRMVGVRRVGQGGDEVAGR